MTASLSSQLLVQPGQVVADAAADLVDPAPRNMSLENPSVSLSSPEAYDVFTDGRSSAAGVTVTPTKALTSPAVWQALTLISGDVAKLPFDLFQKLPDGDRRKAVDDPLHRLVRRKPNRESHAFGFWRRMMVARLLWNNAYALIVRRPDGAPVELLPLLPDRTNAERHNGQLIYVSEIGGELVPFYPEQIFHLEGISLDNLQGHKFILAAREAIGLALAGAQFSAKFYKNGGRVGGILELPASTPPPVASKIEEGFRRTYEIDGAFKTVILRDNAKFHAAQQSLRETQMIDGRRESTRDVARYFNLRPSKLGEDGTTSYNSKAEDNRDYLDNTLSHHLAEIAAEAYEKLLTREQQAAGYYFEHNVGELLRLSLKDQAEAWSKLRAMGVLSSNEIRGQLNLNRRSDAGGDSYENPNTTSGAVADNPAAAARLAAAHRKLVGEGLARITAAAAKVVDRVCKTPDDARTWAHVKLPDWQGTFAKAIAAAVEAHAAAAGCHVETETARLAELATTALAATLREAANAADGLPAAGVKSAVADALKSFQQQRCPEIAAQLTGAM